METLNLQSGLDPASFSTVISAKQDLFRHVNGPWIDTYRLPDDRSRYGSFDRLAENAEEQIHEILEDESSPAQRSQALYRSFLNTQAIEEQGLAAIKSDLDLLSQAESKAELTRRLAQLSPYGGPELFNMSVYGDPGDPQTAIVHLSQGGIGLPDEAYYRDDQYEAVRQAYVDMLTDMFAYAGLYDAQESANVAQRVLDLETRIASHHLDNVALRDPVRTYNMMSFDDIARDLADFDLSLWVQAWQESYDASPASKEQPVNMRQALARANVTVPSFNTGLNIVWKQAELADLIAWAQAHLLISFATALGEKFDKASFAFYGTTLAGAKKQRERWKRAVSLVNGICGEDVGREYVRRHFPQSSKDRMQQLVANLIEAYRVSISTSTWLGEETKKKALEKLSKFTPMIGYTEHWRDYSALHVSQDASLVDNLKAANLYETGFQLAKAGKPVDRGEWLMNPQTVNAYYEPSMNVIVFPAAILQPPFFNPDAEDAVNYGGIGAVIGHEIGHGFDDQGSQFDGDGKLNNWWTDEDRANFESRTARLIAQYNEFVPTQLQAKYADEPEKAPHVNGALTIGENIDDLGGVSIALKAYAFALAQQQHVTSDGSASSIAELLATAPVIDGFTGLQRFFLGYAAIWRTVIRDELAQQYLQIDPHSPAECRTNGIVRNVDLFYQAFDVQPEDAMWIDPSERVTIW